jgi:hypothetical protein
MRGDRKPDCWTGPETQPERLRQMARFILARRPAGVTTLVEVLSVRGHAREGHP